MLPVQTLEMLMDKRLNVSDSEWICVMRKGDTAPSMRGGDRILVRLNIPLEGP